MSIQSSTDTSKTSNPPKSSETSISTSSQASRKGRGRGRDTRNLSELETLRKLVQSLEEDRIRYDRKMEEMIESITKLTNTVATLVANQQQQPASVLPSDRVSPSIESVPKGSTPIIKEPEPQTPRAAAVKTLQPPSATASRMGTKSHLAPLSQSYPLRRSTLTEKIKPLGDGNNPTFNQWKISIRDRCNLNSDHYPTEPARMALIWGTTTGLARTYLEPYFRSGAWRFDTADEMISTLEPYFTTKFERRKYRFQFLDLRMGDKGHENETFQDFQARFQSLATFAEISEDMWFSMLWNKISPQLRHLSMVVMDDWNEDFMTMVAKLNSIDYLRHRN